MVFLGGANVGKSWGEPGSRLVTVAEFEDQDDAYGGAWSIVVEFTGEEGPAGVYSVKVRALMPDAPGSLLGEGITFRLLDGNRPIARVKILDELQQGASC